MIRIILVMVTILVMTLICGVLAIIFGVIVGPYTPVINRVSYVWARSILFMSGTKIHVQGLEKIDLSRNYIFVANHQSHYDVIAMFCVLPLTTRFITKKELFRIPLFGWAIKAVGMIKIDRTDRLEAIKSMNEAIDTIKKGPSLVVFPEGTRSHDGKIGSFKKGGFVIAIKGRFPLVPVSISGSRFILKKHSLKVQPGMIKIVFSDPIATDEYTYNQREELSERVRDIIINNFDFHFNEKTT